MNGIEKITGQISADVQKEIDALMADARTRAGETAQNYEVQAKREADTLLERGQKRAAEHEDRLVSTARLEAKKQVLAAKQDLVEQAFELALKQLLDLPEQEYVDLLARLAASAATTGREKVALSQKDRPRYGKQIVTRANEILGEKARLTLAEECRPIRGGLILVGDRVEVNCSFETLIRLQKESMTAQVAQILFGNAD